MAGLFDDLPNVAPARQPSYGLGNIDLANRPVARNPDGSISTVRSMSVNFDGEEVLIPTVSNDGRILSDDDAIQEYRRTGQFLGKFKTPDEATAYAESLHNDQERQYAAPRQPIASLFDDLPDAPGPLPLGESLMGRARAGAAQTLGGMQQAIGETLGGILAPAQGVMDTIAGRDPAANPVVQGLGDFGAMGADVADIGRMYSRDAQQGITAPDSIGAALADPANAARYYSGILAESAPMMLGAMATRNPAAGAAVMGVGTGGQTYGQERTDGAGPIDALIQGLVAGGMEGGLGQLPLDTALGPSRMIARVPLAAAQEAGTEALTGGGQYAAGQALRGEDIDRGELGRAVVDSLIVGAPLGAIEGVLGAGRPRAAPSTPASTPPLFDDLPDAPAPTLGPAPEDVSDLEAMVQAITPTPSPPAPQDSPSVPGPPPAGPAQAATSPEGVPFMVTRPMREALLAQGMTRGEIAKLTPAEAQARVAAPQVAPQVAPSPQVAAPSIDPDTRAVAAFERDAAELALPPEQMEAVRARLRKPLPRDRVTGLYRVEELDDTLTAAQDSGQPSVYVESDMSNLAGLNGKLGTSGADAYLKQFADTVRAELDPVGATVGIRKGGDELSFIVQGASKQDVDAALSRARDKFAAATAEFADLPHTKGSAPGVGFHYGTSEVLPGQRIGDILRNADTQVELRKKGESYEQRKEAETAGGGSPVAGEAVGGIAPAAAGDATAVGGTGEAVRAGVPEAEVADILALRDEIGWDQRGGKIIRDIEEDGGKGGDVVARTTWVGRPRVNGGFSNFWRDRPDPINEAQARTAFDKLERGEKLGVREQRFIDYARRQVENDKAEAGDWVDPMAPPFSRATTPAAATAPTPMAAAVRSALGPAARDTNVLPSKANLPADVAKRVGALNDRTEGFFDPETGQSYIFEDQVETADRAVWVAFHERAGHVGLRGMLMGQEADRGKAFQAFAATLGRTRQNPTIAAVADSIKASEGYSDTQATEEAIAELAAAVRTGNYGEIESRYGVKVPQAQRQTVAGFIARLVQQLQAALNAMLGRDGGYSDADVYALIEGAWRYVREGGGAVTQRGGPVVSNAPESRTQGIDEGTGLPLNADGTVTVYHHTNKAAADAIHASGRLKAEAEPDVYVTTRRETDTGYGNTAVRIDVDPARLILDDEFPGGRRDFRLEVGRPGGSISVKVGAPVAESRAATPKDSPAVDQTETPAFRRWFAGSKVVDVAGKPLVVYHGTSQSEEGEAFKMFDANGSNYGLFGQGSYFTDDPSVASSYVTKGRGATPSVYPVYMSIQNPIDMDKEVRREFAQWKKAFPEVDFENAERGPRLGPAYTNEDFYRIAEDHYRDEEWVAWEAAEAIGDGLRAMGYDGITHIGGGRVKSDGVKHRVFIAFEPEQVKSATGNSGAFDPANPSILESRSPKASAPKNIFEAGARAEKSRNAAAGTLPVSRGTPGWNYDESKWEGRRGQLKRARTVLQDKMAAWQDVQGQIARQVGQAIPDVQNVYQLENLMHGRVSESIDRMEAAQVEPLVEAMRAAKVSTETLEEYLYARHAKERNAQIASINDAMQDGGSGMTNAEADKILAAADKSTLEPLAKRVDAITKANRQRLLDAGLITQEAFDAMAAQYKAYVPLRGKTVKEADFAANGNGAGRGLDTRRSPIQQAMGRGAGNRAQNILGEIIGDAQRGIILAEKARVGRAVMRLVLANPNPALWQVEPVQTERKVDANGEVYEAVVQDWSDPSIVAVKLKGKTYKVQINSQPLAQALNNVGIDQLGTVTRAAGKINRYFSAILTQYNPAFVPVNASRDALFGLTGLAVEHGELAALDAALNYPKAAIASFKSATNRLGSGEWDTWAREFAESGGKTGYVSMPSVEDTQAKLGKGKLTGYSPTGFKAALRAVGDAVGATNDAVENALRLSAYVTLRKRGMSIEKAASYAKNLTVNFNRKGSSGSALNAWFLFYNAATQGAVRTATLLKRPKTYAYLGALASIQVAGTMALMGMEDEDGESMWNKIPDHVKRRNIVLPLPDGHILTIPMPYGFNLFTYMAGRTTAAVTSDADRPEDRAGKLTADILSAATESFMPVPIGDGAMGFLPTVLRIPANVQTNRNDFGRQIRQENPYGKFDVPRASIGRPDTLEIFKVAATRLNRVGGGDEYTPPPMTWFDHAPEDIEYLLGEVTGGAGKFVIDVATLGEKAAGETPVTMRDVPIANRFATKVNEQAAQQSMYYERADALNRSLERLRDTFERKGEAAAEAMLRDSPELSGVAFKRRKNKGQNGQAPGSIIVSDGRPQVTAVPGSMFDTYKDAEKAVRARNEAMRDAYGQTPASLLPNAATRERDRKMLEENKAREEAQRKFNAAWLRDVVGAAE